MPELEGIISVPDILKLERCTGGMVRHSLDHGDYVENVSINNLVAAGSRLSTDIYGNKFVTQAVLPTPFWDRVLQDARSRSIIPEYLNRDAYGGLLNLLPLCSVYEWTGATVLLHTPHNGVVWELEVGDRHDLLRKEQCLALLGPNQGFDLIVPYLPALGVAQPTSYPALGYAPPEVLIKWIAEGYESPKAILAKIGELSAKEQQLMLGDWAKAGYQDSARILFERGLLAPEVLAALPAPAEATTI